MKKLLVGGLLAASLALAGCGKADAALKELETLKKDACACKDADCANKVETKFEDWMKKNEDTKGSQSQAEKAGKLAGDIQECIAKALAGGDAPAEGGADK
jgi:hypothetical protein